MISSEADNSTDEVVAILQAHFANETHDLPPLHRAFVARELMDALAVIAEEEAERAAERN